MGLIFEVPDHILGCSILRAMDYDWQGRLSASRDLNNRATLRPIGHSVGSMMDVGQSPLRRHTRQTGLDLDF